MNKKLLVILFLVSILVLLISKQIPDLDYKNSEQICRDFIENHLSDDGCAIYTNYLDNRLIKEKAEGHQILSESEGLALLYYFALKDKEMFDLHFNFIREKMLSTDTGLIKWRYSESNENLARSNATIDDLRIIRALILAYREWQDERHHDFFMNLADDLYKSVKYRNLLADHYDFQYKTRAEKVTLSYIDLYTIKLLSEEDHYHFLFFELEGSRWNKIYEKSLKILKEAFVLEKKSSYFNEKYNIRLKRYRSAAKPSDGRINMIDNILINLHLSEVNEDETDVTNWLKERLIKEGRIYSQYYLNGQAVNKEESTAIYALLARLAKNIGDRELYYLSLEKMLQFQIKDSSHYLYGAFGFKNKDEVFSFDNLQALLAF